MARRALWDMVARPWVGPWKSPGQLAAAESAERRRRDPPRPTQAVAARAPPQRGASAAKASAGAPKQKAKKRRSTTARRHPKPPKTPRKLEIDGVVFCEAPPVPEGTVEDLKNSYHIERCYVHPTDPTDRRFFTWCKENKGKEYHYRWVVADPVAEEWWADYCRLNPVTTKAAGCLTVAQTNPAPLPPPETFC